MSKETLVVIVGAGASIAAGIPSTAQLTKAAKAALPPVPLGPRFGFRGVPKPPPPPTSLELILDDALKMDYGSDYDFELLLDVLEELEAFLAPRHRSIVLGAINLPPLPAFADLKSKFASIHDWSLMSTAKLAVLTQIYQAVGNACASAGPALAARAQLTRIFQALDARFRLIVIDFNYDDLIDSIPLKFQDGYAHRMSTHRCNLFSPDAWDNALRGDSPLLLHLHGSVRYGYRPSGALTTPSRFAEPAKFDSIGDAQSSLVGRGVSGTLIHGKAEDAAFIVSGLAKAARLAYNARPYGYYYKAAMDFLSRTERLLVLGYGWRDTHINTWVREYVGLRANRRTAVVTLRPGSSGISTLEHQELLWLGGADWSSMESFAYARTAAEKAIGTPSRFRQSGQFAVAPDGFLMDMADELKLLNFMV